MSGTEWEMAAGFFTILAVMIGLWRAIKTEMREIRREFKTLRENDLQHVDAGIAGLHVRIGELKTDLLARIGGVRTDLEARIDGVRTDLDARLGRMDARIAKVDQRLGIQIEAVRTDVRDARTEIRETRTELLEAIKGLAR